MFGDNLKAIRKAKGYTQEELAVKLNVVRQTVSKWEKNLSVPDADILSRIAEILETNVSVLLGGEFSMDEDKNNVAQQLSKISEQLAIKNRRSKKIWKAIGIILAAFILFFVIIVLLNTIRFNDVTNPKNSEVIEENIEKVSE